MKIIINAIVCALYVIGGIHHSQAAEALPGGVSPAGTSTPIMGEQAKRLAAVNETVELMLWRVHLLTQLDETGGRGMEAQRKTLAVFKELKEKRNSATERCCQAMETHLGFPLTDSIWSVLTHEDWYNGGIGIRVPLERMVRTEWEKIFLRGEGQDTPPPLGQTELAAAQAGIAALQGVVVAARTLAESQEAQVLKALREYLEKASAGSEESSFLWQIKTVIWPWNIEDFLQALRTSSPEALADAIAQELTATEGLPTVGAAGYPLALPAPPRGMGLRASLEQILRTS